MFEIFVTLASRTRNVPGVEHDDAEDESSFTKLGGIVPTWYQISAGIDDVVLHEFIVFEVKFTW